jgi:hypothetical protein
MGMRNWMSIYKPIVSVAFLIFVALVLSVSAQQSNSTSAVFHNERLKTLALKDSPITGDNERVVSGVSVSESKDPAKTLVFPVQVKIVCTHSDKTCRELSITLGPTPGIVNLTDLDETEYSVDTWDAHGLLASYGGDSSSRCQRHVLTMDFDSGAVSVSDIPTHKKGCEAFTETDSYRLVRGNYYVDTSPGNDMDKSKK